MSFNAPEYAFGSRFRVFHISTLTKLSSQQNQSFTYSPSRRPNCDRRPAVLVLWVSFPRCPGWPSWLRQPRACSRYFVAGSRPPCAAPFDPCNEIRFNSIRSGFGEGTCSWWESQSKSELQLSTWWVVRFG